jgi:hypothetical protein
MGGDSLREQGFPTLALRGFAGLCGSFRRPPAGSARDGFVVFIATNASFLRGNVGLGNDADESAVGEPVEGSLPDHWHDDLDLVGCSYVGVQDVLTVLDGADNEYPSSHEPSLLESGNRRQSR